MLSGPPSTESTTADESPGRSARGLHAPCLCLALESERPLLPPALHTLAQVDAVTIGRSRDDRGAELLGGGERVLALTVPDRWMSSSHALLRRVLGRWMALDAGSKNGTFVNGRPITRVELADGDVLEVGHTFFVFREDGRGPAQVSRALALPGLATLQGELAEQLRALELVAKAKVSVVLRGESGTGKEVLARAVHALSLRPGPFVAINCGALPGALVESELFGYRKGAFSGALEDRPGLVRSADHGTLFLDEIGDLPLPLQTSLLRVLQESEVLPVGATRPVAVDLRVIVATHRDLEGMSSRGEFRHDLLARLSGLTVEVPPLRERREDLGLLVAALLKRLLGEGAASVAFGLPAARALLLHPWPLNVRELEKALGVAAALAENGRIELAHLPASIRAPPSPPQGAAAVGAPPRPLSPGDAVRRDEIVELLRAHQGNVTAVARAMGKARVQVQRWLKRFGLDPGGFRT